MYKTVCDDIIGVRHLPSFLTFRPHTREFDIQNKKMLMPEDYLGGYTQLELTDALYRSILFISRVLSNDFITCRIDRE